MAKCTDCFHYEACSGFMPTDLDEDVWHYCVRGIPEEIPDIDQRCDSFKDRKSWIEVVRCKDCKNWNDGICKSGFGLAFNGGDDFCSYGGRKDNG